MKNNIYCILAVVAGTILSIGCSKENLPDEKNNICEIILNAELSVDLTKTSVDATDRTKVNWSDNDSLSIWGGENNKFILSNGVGTTNGSFKGTVTTGTAQYALYPYSSTASISDGVITTSVPRTQTVPAASFDPKAAIMVGTISGETITFSYAVAYLKITAPSNVTNLTEITIESNGGVQLTGDAKFTASTGAFAATATGTKNKFVTVKPAGGTFVAGGIYYAAVIPGTYTGGLTVRYLYRNTTAHTLTENTKSNSSALTIAAGNAKLLGAATSFDHTYEAVQLWADGPYWATTNIGATKVTDNGQYFAWGYTAGQIPTGSTFSTAFNTTNYPDLDMTSLDSEHDMATANWGTWWSVPTSSHINKLKSTDYTSIEYVKSGSTHWNQYKVKGILVTGIKNGYTTNSIFFPAAGHGNGSSLTNDVYYNGSYWSRNYSKDYQTQAYSLRFGTDCNPTQISLAKATKCYGFTVRPIHN